MRDTWRFSVPWILVVLVIALPAAAQVAGARPVRLVAQVNVSPTVVDWQPLVAYERLVLTVSGPEGITLRQEFEAGQAFPSFELGADLLDGSYTWELRAIPRLSAEVHKALVAAREAGDDSFADQLRKSGTLPEEPLVQSGYLLIRDGAFVTADEAEPPSQAGLVSRRITTDGLSSTQGELKNTAAADQVILDDLIVTGSTCVGFDCVNGENFGFDTVRLKENNLRIKFQDTSNSASFPSNDWQITANDSASGGANKFSIDDIDAGRTPFTIEAAAPSNSLYVDDGGRLGLGTSTPVVDVHVVSGNTPTLRLEQNGSSGFTPQTWDVAGNETNFFIRDVTNGSKLPFRIRPSAPTSSIDIASSGNVGMGTSSPDAPLHLLNSTSTFTDGQLHIENTNSTAAERVLLKLENNGKTRFELRNTSGTATSWTFDNNGDTFTISKVGTGVNEASLDGSGNLVIKGSLTTGTSTVYPDFVFEPGYDLMPLVDLAAFIDKNGHLPMMPTADEVLKKGSYNMTDLQMKLLQKVEELTLYTLTQEQQLSDLAAENLKLKEKNEEIAVLQERLARLEALLAPAQ